MGHCVCSSESVECLPSKKKYFIVFQSINKTKFPDDAYNW